MSYQLIQYIKDYSEGKGWPCESDKDIHEILSGAGNAIYQETVGSHRWYDDVFRVVELGEKDGKPVRIGFVDAHTTGDNSPSDIGWEFDADSICEVEEKEKTVTYYVAVKS